ncbi:titin isoform X2 [Diabrotica virgifera virgifera]|uniref:Uncharacterized protein n=1 Tax=Diabrotica virgifera virgifera TaxID=50390 RepID=A0ABM5KTR9_DIAVI|nr:titin isoform X2 [Diabrotica virgifera virgifera]
MKRKRKNACPSPLLDDSPKRTKVHAQRKFAQGSNVNSPVITPIRELEAESPKLEDLPEPVELLPIKRPNTEDFLTFLCFRGTPVLPANLNFFNTASIVDTNGQVHEIKSETSLKHGPIDVAKCGTSSEKPFVAFGVRKRADPVVISRQMDRKRRHALALQALRRKYQEQKMAKIRALTISKLSEKVTNKTLVRTNTVSKTETITKKNSTLQKTKVVATKHIKVTTLKTTLKPKMNKMKQNMCLRSFRGRFIQQELPFRKKMGQNKRIVRNAREKRTVIRKRNKDAQEKATLPGTSKQSDTPVSQPIRRKLVKQIVTPSSDGSRLTRSSLTNTKSEIMRKQIKCILIPNRTNNPLIKARPRALRLTTVKKSVLSRRKSNSLKTKQRMRAAQKQHNVVCETSEKTEETKLRRSPLTNKIESKQVEKKDIKETISKNVDTRRINRNTDIKKDFKKVVDIKKENSKVSDRDRRQRTRSVDVKKEINKSSTVKTKPTSSVEVKKSSRMSNVIRKNVDILKSANKGTPVVHNKTVKSHTEESSRRSSRNLDTAKKPKTHTQEAVIEDNKSGIDAKGKQLSSKNIKCKNTGLRGKMTLTKSNPLKVLKYKQKMEDRPPDLVKTENKCSEQYKQEEINNDTVMETKTIQTRIEDQPPDVPSVETVKKIIVNIEPIEKINQENECSDEDPDDKGLVIDEDYKENEIDSKQSVSQNEIEDKKVNSEIIPESIEGSNHSKDVHAKQTVTDVDDLNEVEETVDLVVEANVQTVDLENITQSTQDEKIVESSETVPVPSDVIDELNTVPESAENHPEHKSSEKETIEKGQIIDNVTIKTITKRKDKESVKESVHTAKDETETIKKTTKTKSSTRKDVKEQHLRTKCEDDVLPRSQRPSRKTKEAAAIYMEILSHKLVNDNQKDDDNVSIDSFPELPNVKKTEQREIELKAKAKTSKEENKDKLKSKNEDVENIVDKEDVKNTNAEVVVDDNSTGNEGKSTSKSKHKFTGNDEIIPKTKNKEGKIGKRKPIPDNLVESDDTIESKMIKSDAEKQTSTTDVKNTNAEVVVDDNSTGNEGKNTSKAKHKFTGNDEVIPKTKNKESKIGKRKTLPDNLVESDDTVESKIIKSVAEKQTSTTDVKNTNAEVVVDDNSTGNEGKSASKAKHKFTGNDEVIPKTKNKEGKIGKRKPIPDNLVESDDTVESKMIKSDAEKQTSTTDVKNTNAEVVVDDNSTGNEGKSASKAKHKFTSNDEVIQKIKNKEGKIGKRKTIPDNLVESDDTVESKIMKSDAEKQTSTTDEVHVVLEACGILQQSESSVEKDSVVEELKSESNKEVMPDQPVKLTRPKIEKSECMESPKAAIEEAKVVEISEDTENKEIIDEDLKQKLRQVEYTDNVDLVVENVTPKLKTFEQKETTDLVEMSVVVQEPTPKLKKSEQKVKIETVVVHTKTKLKTTHQTETPDKLSEHTQPKTRKVDQIETSEPVTNDLPSKLKKSHTNNAEVSAETKDKLMDKEKIVSKPTAINESPKRKSRKSDAPTRRSDPLKVSETTEESKPRRFTRHSLHATRSEDCDSDESFHIDVKVPRKKKNTRSRGSQRSAKGTKQLEMSSSDSDRSTTSDVNTPTSASKGKHKKFTKTKPVRKLDTVDNTRENMDTDEEEVLIPKGDEPSQKSLPKEEKPKDNAKDTGKSKKTQNRTEKLKSSKSPDIESTKVEPKPKRECAKLPQNYLPMLSSSDEDEIFHGFDEKTAKNTKSCETSCGHAPPLLDLLNKDLGRRFGKEKVNMSKEQIEKWLKDAALAGSSLKKENDEMLKFGERIPTETNMEIAGAIDTEKLKQSLSELSHFRKPSIKQDSGKGTNKDESEGTLEAEDSKQFYVPQKPTAKSTTSKAQNKPLFKSKSSEKLLDIDEFKYKIPSSPSASSSSSAKLYKRQPHKQKTKAADSISPVYVSDFPKPTEPAKLVEAPVFHPTEQEFQDPLEYIERIRHKAEQFGICKIVPPSNFKPECKVTDDMRFTAYNQYVNKMLYRWGPNYKEFVAIKKYLETQSIALNHPPWIGGMEIDLPRLYQTVQSLGGLRDVIEKKKWSKVSDIMKIPKSAQDRVTKLDDIYCKYLLPYDILSPAEREKLFDEVESEWVKKESRKLTKTQGQKNDDAEDNTQETEADVEDFESEECTTKGRNMALNAFYRIARNTMSMYFKTNDPLPQEVEQEYWKYVSMRQNHICVHSGSIDCGNWGYGFAVSKNSPFARHPWNLKVLTNNGGSVLRSLGPLMGVTVPTLHVGMVFSACCWYRDPHGLPWIEYLHTGGSKIWYGIPNSMGEHFHSALNNLVPSYCKDKELWLPSDTVMVPPNLLVENQVSLCHAVQEPGQYVIVFPKSFTSSISTGYVVSESVYFAPIYWLKTARSLFDALRKSNEPAMFSFDRLLINVVNDPKCNIEIVRQALPLAQELSCKEIEKRDKLYTFGEIIREKLPIPEVNRGKKKKFQQGDEGDYECDICRSSLFLSMIFDMVEGITYCLDHGTELIEKKDLNLANCKFMFTYDDQELKELPDKVKTLIDTRHQKKVPNKFAGLPTLLGK